MARVCATMAALGRPVVPEVYIFRQGSAAFRCARLDRSGRRAVPSPRAESKSRAWARSHSTPSVIQAVRSHSMSSQALLYCPASSPSTMMWRVSAMVTPWARGWPVTWLFNSAAMTPTFDRPNQTATYSQRLPM